MNIVYWRKAAIVVAALALSVSACGSDTSSAGSAADGEPQEGGTLQIIQASEPRGLDPTSMSNSFSTNTVVGNALYGQLLVNNADGEVEPVMAQSLTSDDGGTTWKLVLRDGLEFSDRSPMTAEAVKLNWERHQDPALGSGARAAAMTLDSMSASGQTLTFTLTEPIANYGNAILTNGMNWIAKPEALEEGPAAFDAEPIGAGPFTLESWQRNGAMVLKKNPSYWDSPKPYLDELVVTSNGDERQRYATVVSGGAEATMSSSTAHQARGKEDGLGLRIDQTNGGTPFHLNTRIAPFDDVRARRALLNAVDLEELNTAVFDGEATVPTTMFIKSSPFFSDVPLESFDPEAAQELFDELAADGKPFDVLISVFQTSEQRRTGESIQAQLLEYDNVTAELEVLDFASANAKTNSLSFHMIAGGFGFVDPDPALYDALHTGSPANFSGISDPELDAALEKGRLSSTLADRQDAYATAAQRYADLVPNFLFARYEYGIAFNDEKSAGFELYGFGGTRWDGVWVTGK